MQVGGPELLVLLGAVLLLFGPNKLPEIARSLGQATRQYKRGMKEAKSSIMGEFNGNPSKPLTENEKIKNTAKELGISTEDKNTSEIAQEILNITENN